MSIQQSVNNMLATAAVVGGVAKHGIEEEAKNKLAAIDEYFGNKEKLLNLQAEREQNKLAIKENNAGIRNIKSESDETYENIETARDLQRINEDKMTELANKDYSVMSEAEEGINKEEYGRAYNTADFYRKEQKEGYNKLKELNMQNIKLRETNRGLKKLMEANLEAQNAAKLHMEAVKSGRYKKFIEKIEGGKK